LAASRQLNNLIADDSQNALYCKWGHLSAKNLNKPNYPCSCKYCTVGPTPIPAKRPETLYGAPRVGRFNRYKYLKHLEFKMECFSFILNEKNAVISGGLEGERREEFYSSINKS
jgi:hypothetical protein